MKTKKKSTKLKPQSKKVSVDPPKRIPLDGGGWKILPHGWGIQAHPRRLAKASFKTVTHMTKKDACYHKVKARYKVWPSAYASGAIAKCRKVGLPTGATEQKVMLRSKDSGWIGKRWFKEDWRTLSGDKLLKGDLLGQQENIKDTPVTAGLLQLRRLEPEKKKRGEGEGCPNAG